MRKIVFIIGVSGCGKSTIGDLLSKKTKIPFFDGDDFHPQANIDKMASGEPLNDIDRKEWLIDLNKLARQELEKKGAIIACSALKESYRVQLEKLITQNVTWVFLKGSKDFIKERLASRQHFMPASLLQSQFDTLEIPNYGLHLSIKETPEIIVQTIQKQLQL